MELTSELHKALAAAWAAFAMGMIIFHGYRHCSHGWLLSRLLLFLSPAILSGYGIHSVQVCNQILAAKQGEAVDDRVYLASVTRSDLGGGVRIEWEHYSDSGQSVCVEVSPGTSKAEDTQRQTAGNAARTGSVTERFIPLSEGMRFGGNSFTADAYDGRTGLGIAF